MKSNRRPFLQLIQIALCVSALVLAFAPSAQVLQSAQVSTTSRGGLQTVTFDTFEGKVIVNLPDDMMAGDTISGTVMVEPKGQESDGRSLSMELLFDTFKTVNVPTSGGSPETFTLKIPAGAGNDKAAGQIKLTLKGEDGAYSYVNFDYGFWEYHVAATNETLGQPGRPVEIPGHFDGSFENTSLRVGDQEALLLAESPRKAVFESPRNVLGPAEIVIKEGKVETKRMFRNVAVRLSAPKTNLLKGESTTLTVRVAGLQGIKEDVPLHLDNASPAVVRMDGGDKQTLRITPSMMQPDGTFSTTRSITGQQAGSFSVTAKVVVFNLCVADDNDRNWLSFSSETGDYIFCAVKAQGGNTDARVETTGVMDFSGGVVLQTGSAGDVTRKGCVITLQQNAPDRRVQAQFDRCTQTGSATVQPGPGKTTFTITDRDTRNNTCTCR